MSERENPFSRLKNKAAEFRNYLTETDDALPGADPFITTYGDSLLYIVSNYRSVSVRQVPDLQHLGDRSHEATVLRSSDGIWAPELHFLEGRWYALMSISGGNSQNAEMYVFASEDADPLGRYELQSRVSPGRWAIDMTYLQHNDQLYAIFSSTEGGGPGFPQGLYIAPMSDPLHLRADPVRISTPEHTWEKHGAPVNEGPQIRIKDGKVQLIYSASASWTGKYRMGRLALIGDPMNPLHWVKDPSPFYKENFGHGCFVVLPDGSEWVVAGEKLVPDEAGWDRVVRVELLDESRIGATVFQDVPDQEPAADGLESINPMAA